jgi:hypothetical protein
MTITPPLVTIMLVMMTIALPDDSGDNYDTPGDSGDDPW